MGGGQQEIWGIDARVIHKVKQTGIGNKQIRRNEREGSVSEDLLSSDLLNLMDAGAFTTVGQICGRSGVILLNSDVDQPFGDAQMKGVGGDANF